jgi:hypothetical protein
MAFIPFGTRTGELGFKSFPEGPASQPSSFAIGDDNTLWVADRWRFRMVHYTLEGRYLGAVPIDPHVSRIQDIVATQRAIYASTYYQYGHVRAVEPDMTVHPINVHQDGRPLVVEEIYGTALGLVARIYGYSEDLQDPRLIGGPRGPIGYFLVNANGTVARLDGIPLGPDRSVAVEASGDTGFSLTFRAPGEEFVQSVDVELWRAGARRSTQAVPTLDEISPYQHGIVSLVGISADTPRNEHDGGRWLLRIGEGPILWERLPEPGIQDDPPQSRHIAVGPDGAIYLMLAEKGGELILRRP